MKTDSELILMGLKSAKRDVIGRINKRLKDAVEHSEQTDLNVNDLNKLTEKLGELRGELAEIDGRILKLEPQFAADDIPF